MRLGMLRVLTGLALALVLGWSGTASAMLMTPSSVTFDFAGNVGSIDYVGDSAGLPAGGEMLFGSSTGTALIFQGFITTGELKGVKVELDGAFGDGVGRIPGPVTNPLSTATIDKYDAVTNLLKFKNLKIGKTTTNSSDPFFITFASLPESGELSFEFIFKNGSAFATMSTTAEGSAPEPSSLLLLGMGILGASVLARRRRA